jgi:2-polyprenyl-6-methoxyphenol hydroxylase-like FAD-dependent oxidoreductase/carbon monoxide dehydrogenase subunit G
MRTELTRCCVVGGGPAGMMLAVLLAHRGLDVMVLEKHADFLRDFRGDTVHPSTLEVVAELGWLEEFLRLPHTTMSRVTVDMNGGPVTFADFRKVPARCRYIVFMPQWDFLDFLADKAGQFPGFRLLLEAEVTDLIEESGRVAGVRAQTPDGAVEVRADLVVGADGRHSVVRKRAGLEAIPSSPPMDVLWFRLSRRPDETLPFFQTARGSVLICIDRDEYWQAAYVIPSGAFSSVHAKGLDAFRASIASILPGLADRVGEIGEWDDVRPLSVRVDRLRRWYRPGLLCIGDAAHAMSPAGGVGINLAIQDAVATANIVGPAFGPGRPTARDLQRVQRRRELPARVTQAVQVRALRGLYPKNLHDNPSEHPPLAFRLFRRLPPLRYLTGYFIGIGIRPEHIRGEVDSIAASIEVSRRPEEVFSYATDLSRFPEWQGNVVSAQWDDSAPLGVGSRAAVIRRVGPRTLATTEEITELSPPRSSTVRGVGCSTTAIAKTTIEPLDNGNRSRVTITFEFEANGIGRLLLPLVIRQVRKQLRRNVEKLKAVLERGA